MQSAKEWNTHNTWYSWLYEQIKSKSCPITYFQNLDDSVIPNYFWNYSQLTSFWIIQALIAFNTTGRNLQTRLQDSQAVTFNMRTTTQSQMGISLFPSDLNTTNMVLSGVIDLLEESLDTSETDISDQVCSLSFVYLFLCYSLCITFVLHHIKQCLKLCCCVQAHVH